MKNWRGLLLAAVFAIIATPASAAIIYIDLGTGAPPATVGGYTMTPFPTDVRLLSSDVTSVAAPGGGAVGFDVWMNLRTIGSGWATWSHGYTGDVYFSNGATAMNLTLQPGTHAFYLYLEPNPYDLFEFDVCSGTTCSGPRSIHGHEGALGFAFYGTSGDTISSITISGPVDFGIGEFGIARSVPEPVTLLLMGVGFGVIARRRPH